MVLVREERVPPADTAAALRLEPDVPAFHVKRLRMADGAPVSIDDAWLVADAFPGLLDHDLSGSVYSIFADEYGTADRPGAADGRGEAGGRRRRDPARHEDGAPVLEFDRVSYAGDRPVEHARSWYRSDRYRVQMEVTATPAVA